MNNYIAGDDVCGSLSVAGPFDEHGNDSPITELLPLYVNGTAPVVISCRVTTNQSLDGINPRLRFYLTRDGAICTLRSGTGSHTCPALDNEYEHFRYEYNQTKGTNVINFTYYISPIARMDQSVVTCGVEHYRTGAHCFGQLAALISFQDGPTCGPRPSTTIIKEMPTITKSPKSTEPPTTTRSPTITECPTNTCIWPSMTTKISNTETPTISTTRTASDTPVSTAETDTISVKQDTFFSAVAIIILVGIILVAANFIQMWVIIKFRRAAAPAAAIDPPDEHGIEFDEHHTEIHQHSNVEEATMIENSMAKENG